ncbi:MAG: C1 family peptidase [Prevotellaceae bacterium]|nr:C1 family peptidase [Prevotellaceae bacterium]
MMKNSWGKDWGRHGFICLSENYLRQNTIAVWMN